MTTRWKSALLMLTILFAACLTAVVATNASAAIVPVADGVTVRPAPGDSISITGYFHLTGNTSGLDSIRTTLEQPPGVVFTAKVVGPTATTVTYGMARPATAITGKVCITTLYIGATTVTPNSCSSWSYTPPGAVADSVKVARLWLEPKNAVVEVGGHLQFCTFIVFADSGVAMRDQDSPACAKLYMEKIPVERQTYGAGARQAVADAMCIRYTATGGTVTSDVCEAPSGSPAGRST
jgi:hypothetical protein